jgi:hypothetical protein
VIPHCGPPHKVGVSQSSILNPSLTLNSMSPMRAEVPLWIQMLSREIIESRTTAGDLFLDTSALAKRHLTEKGSLRVRRLLENKGEVFYQTFLSPWN